MIDLSHVSFGYHHKQTVLDDFSLSLKSGAIYGLLGKNGTGKSTLLYLMSGLLFPRTGTVVYKGMDVTRREVSVLQDMFLIPEEVALPAVTIRKYMEMYAPFYPRFSEEKMQVYLKDFELDDCLNLAAISMGQRKKAYICFALACNVSLLLMDEPTNGLDIPSKSQFRKVMASCMNEECTMVISTHQVRDLESLLDHILIIDNGGLLINSSVSDITNRLCFDELHPGETVEDEILVSVPSLTGSSVISRNADHRETPFNIELFFNAMFTEREKMEALFAESKD